MVEQFQILQQMIDQAVGLGFFKSASSVFKAQDALEGLRKLVHDQYMQIQDLQTKLTGQSADT